MLGIYIAIAVVGVLILIFFVDELPKYLMPEKEKDLGKNYLKLLASTAKLIQNPKQLALIPLTMYSGFIQAAFNAEFTKVSGSHNMLVFYKLFLRQPTEIDRGAVKKKQ